MELLKLLSTNEIVAQIISFLILVFFLRLFAWKKILALLDARKERIANELKKIEETKQEVVVLKASYEKKIEVIEETSRKKISEAISEGRKITDEIRKKAYEESQVIIENARKSMGDELAKAKEQLKEEIIDITISATQSVIEEKCTEENDRKLVQYFIEKLDKV